jgi:hypothetical protein
MSSGIVRKCNKVMIKKNISKTLKELFIRFDLEGDPDLYLNELESDRHFLDSIETVVAPVPEFITKHFTSIFQLGGAYKTIQYVLVRILKPEILVETGVLHGLSSAFILSAIKKNKAGRLISIDKPAYKQWRDRPLSDLGKVDSDSLPENKESGWAIPEYLRCNWELRLGVSLEELPVLFEDMRCNYFVHDSEHTYENMMFELNTAWQNIAFDGIIVCDNVDWSSAFSDFCKQNKIDSVSVSEEGNIDQGTTRFGIIRKA